MPSVTSLERAYECPASHVLPRVIEPAEIAAELGTNVHAFIVRSREAGRDAALAEIPVTAPHRMFCEQLPLDALPEGGELEVAFAYDPQTARARVLGRNIDREYERHGLLPHEVPGTADIVGVVGDTVVVLDWKTGRFDLGPAIRSWQLRALALFAARVYRKTRARVGYWYLREDGTIHEEAAELDIVDLEVMAGTILATVNGIQRLAASEGVPDTKIGGWCRFCPSIRYCPGHTQLLRAALVLDPELALTPDHFGAAWQLIERVSPILESIKKSLQDIARESPFPTPDGRTVKPVLVEKESLDPAATAAVLAEYGLEVMQVGVEMVASKESLKRAARLVAMRRSKKIAPVEREMLAKIDEVGGVKVKVEEHVKAIRPRKAG